MEKGGRQLDNSSSSSSSNNNYNNYYNYKNKNNKHHARKACVGNECDSTYPHARRAYDLAAVLLQTADRSTTAFRLRSSSAFRTRSTRPGGFLSGQCT